jgi:hypothetical protein
MDRKGPNVSPTVATTVICLALGGAIGFFTKSFLPSMDYDNSRTVSQPGGGGSGPPPGMMGGMGGGGFGGSGGGFGGGGNAGGMALARLVNNLDTIEKAQGNALTPEQAKTILPILQKLKSAEKIPADEAQKQTDAIRAALNDSQKTMLDGMQPQRGGGGGFGGGGRGGPGGPGGGPPGTAVASGPPGTPVTAGAPGGPPMGGGPSGGGRPGGGPPGGMGGMMGGGGGGGRPDPERPFASERNQKALDSLIAQAGKK